jgi:hypothetical protein
LEERNITLEEKKARMELIADENKTMVMDPSTMDAYTREWWDMTRLEIIENRRQARLDASSACGGADGGDDGPVSGDGLGDGDDDPWSGDVSGGATSKDGVG